MADTKVKADAERRDEPQGRVFEVAVSFNGMNKGDRFEQAGAEDLAWAAPYVEAGYLVDVTGHPTAREVHHASEERKG